MALDSNDPRITAYALGQLEPDERDEVARLLEAQPELKAEAAAIGQLADRLTAALASEPATEPADDAADVLSVDYVALERAAAEQAALSKDDAAPASEKPTVASRATRRRWLAGGIATAACVLIAATLAIGWLQQQESRRVAMLDWSFSGEEETPVAQSLDSDRPMLHASAESAPVDGADPTFYEFRNGEVWSLPQQQLDVRSTSLVTDLPEGMLAESLTVEDSPSNTLAVTSSASALSTAVFSADSPARGLLLGPQHGPAHGFAPADVDFSSIQRSPDIAHGDNLTVNGGTLLLRGQNTYTGASTFEQAPAGAYSAANAGRELNFRLSEQTGGPQSFYDPADAQNMVTSRERLTDIYGAIGDRFDVYHDRDGDGVPEPSVEVDVAAIVPRIIIGEEEELLVEEPAVVEEPQQHNTEAYDAVEDNPFLPVVHNPLSTFSIDVDTASYSNVRRMLNDGMLPPPGAVRIEEMLNYFAYDYQPPAEGEAPFAARVEVATCPWNAEHRLARVALKGREISAQQRPACNLVFLVDVSGSMEPDNKLPLLKRSLSLLVERLNQRDRVAMVVYAGSSGLVLPSTTGENRETIAYALQRLEAGGSTNGAAGIEQAYDQARSHLIEGGVNRVILCTDGDFNVGITDQSQLVEMIEARAAEGVFLSVLGFGMGNYKDSTLEKLADHGNGNYAYIDTQAEARKVLVDQLEGTLVTIAKDVKIQVEFNPLEVAAYRLIGYENRLLRAEDFNDDLKDAGEIGAGHSVTALYEIVPVRKAQREEPKEDGASDDASQGDSDSEAAAVTEEEQAEGEERPVVDPLRYVRPAQLSEAARSGELFTIKLRYKEPDAQRSKLIEFPVRDEQRKLGQASDDFRFAASVAGFGMLLRNSPHRGNLTMAAVAEMAQAGVGDDAFGYRAEFVELIKKARQLRGE